MANLNIRTLRIVKASELEAFITAQLGQPYTLAADLGLTGIAQEYKIDVDGENISTTAQAEQVEQFEEDGTGTGLLPAIMMHFIDEEIIRGGEYIIKLQE